MKKALRISAIVVTSLLLIVMLLMLWLTTHSGKNFLRGRIVSFLEKKLKTEVYIGELDYKIPKRVELFDVYLGDQRKDTLLAARHMRVNINMIKLLADKVEVEEVQIDNAVTHLYRIAPDTSFNFDFVVKAFAAPPNPQAQNAPTDSSGRLQLDIRKLMLNKVYVRYDDYTGGDRFAIGIDTLLTTVSKVDPYSQDYRINTLYINGLRSSFSMDTSYLVKNEKDSVAPLPNISAQELNLKNVVFNFKNNNDQLAFDLNIGSLFTHPQKIDLNNQDIAVNDLRLDSSDIVLLMGRKAAAKAEKLVETNPAPSKKWRFTAQVLKLNGVNYKMDNNAMAPLAYGLDYAHMNLQNVVADAQPFIYTTDTISANIRHLALREKSGLDVKELRTVFIYHPKGIYTRNLYLRTSESELRDYISITYPSLDALSKNVQSLGLQVNLKNSTVGMRDVLLFAPQLRGMPLFRKYGNDRVKLNATATGTMAALNIQRLQLQGFGNSVVDLNGKLNGLSDPKKLSYDLNIARLQSNKTVVSAFLPAATLKQIDLPNSFSVTGKISGNASTVNPNLIATTSDGAVTIRGQLALGTGQRYDMVIKANRLNIGKIIRQKDMIGTITGTVSAKGAGFDLNHMNAVLSGDIASAAILGYTYRNVSFNAKVANKAADVKLVSNDSNANLKLDGNIAFNNKYPAIVARIVAEHVNLKALNLSKDDVRFAGTIDANIPVLNPDYPRGSVTINRPDIILNGQRYYVDSLYVTSTPGADSGNYIVVHTSDIEAVISGHTPLTQIGTIIQSHINRHYAGSAQDSIRSVKAAPASYDLHVNAFMKNGPLIGLLAPGLVLGDTARLEAGLTPNTLFANLAAPSFRYNDMAFTNARANIKGDNAGLNYNVALDRYQQGSMDFWYATATGNIANQTITSRVSIADQQKQQRFGVGFVFHQHPDKQELHINDGLVLNYKPWSVSQPNAIVFSKDGFYVQNFRISNGGESVTLNSTAPQYSAPMTIAIKDFLLSNITQIVSTDTLLANGIINGNITVQDYMKNPQVSGNLQVNNLSVKNDTIGDVTAQLNSASINAVNARVAINGRGNDIALTGYYYPKPVNGNNFDLVMHVNKANVRTLEGLTSYAIKNSTGNIRGDLKITGTMAKPLVAGTLYTDSLTTTVAQLGARFSMPAEKIVFTPSAIQFQNFRLVDATGNAARVNGEINITDLNNLGLDLTVRANKFEVLNSTGKDNDLFYGKLLITSNLQIGGTMNAPNISGNLTVNDSTKLTVVVPQAQATAQDYKGIVEFVNKHDSSLYKLPMPQDTVPKLGLRAGSYANVNLTIQKNAELNIVVDQGTGDFLRVRGEAALNTVINPDGTLGVTGIYELSQGSYQFNYNFIKRRFDIQQGSTIIFSGDPLQAQINITAAYHANVPPYELVEKQVSDPTQLIYFKQRLPFQVQLKLTGALMQPEIAFDIVLPEDRGYGVSSDVTSLVQAKLVQLRNDPENMNKQVFAMLLLNRFVSDNPFESATGETVGYLAKQSVSTFLSEQLNRFASDLIAGVDLTVDVQSTEDYTTGQKRDRTDLSITASKRLLNDRLTLTLGNNFELEGPNNNRNQNTSFIPSNIAADYELTRTGRYKVRLYRKSDEDDIQFGYVTETGAKFILTGEYNKFRNLFINRRKRVREMREQEQNRQKTNPNTTAHK